MNNVQTGVEHGRTADVQKKRWILVFENRSNIPVKIDFKAGIVLRLVEIRIKQIDTHTMCKNNKVQFYVMN